MTHVAHQDNLPKKTSKETKIPRTYRGLRFRWGRFQLSDADVASFKQLLEDELGAPLPWTDDEIRAMAYQSIELVTLIYGASAAAPKDIQNEI